ncbi:hypothetical protein CWATWH0402_3349 [Crocosphaera watsonii WH 0402]|uniref:Uncharacterized protein n=3 Tax=Crocosphaera watsonii TaxID=263511 RepID=T2JTK0_CROWT|nr:hypothetical protein CWATWH0005_5318 [Crocosphaera watsonii WH 0005]CCQ63534.1 hypothetical protein CWATWH0401_868 [Crocosphaera watsonii WH 0401]CCQ67927.1 hypothetical protein CWATWH0402_3349 [Crocosphaera watsonii WH 0402]
MQKNFTDSEPISPADPVTKTIFIVNVKLGKQLISSVGDIRQNNNN